MGKLGKVIYYINTLKKIPFAKDIKSSFQGTIKKKMIKTGFLSKKLGI